MAKVSIDLGYSITSGFLLLELVKDTVKTNVVSTEDDLKKVIKMQGYVCMTHTRIDFTPELVSNTLLEWTNEQVIRLVNEYRSKPELWDSHHNLYRVQTAKYEAFCQLAESFECDVTDLKKKLNSIFASHRREKGKLPADEDEPKRATDGKESYNGTNKKPKKAKKRRISEDEDEEEEDDDDEESEHSQFEDDDGEVAEEIIIKEEPEVVPAYKPQYKNTYKPQPKVNYSTHRPRLTRVLRRKVVKEPRNDVISSSKLLDTMKLLKKSDLLKKKDECDSFGEYIAVSLRKHDDRTQSMIKQAINNILFEQEMKKYNTAQYTVVLSGMEENPLLEQET